MDLVIVVISVLFLPFCAIGGMWWCLGRCPNGGFHRWKPIRSDCHSRTNVCPKCGTTRLRGYLF